MKQPLTSRQNEVLQFIKSFTREHGYAPSLREIAAAMNITSPNGVVGHLGSLQRKGWITQPDFGSRLARAIVVIDDEPARNEEDLHRAIRMLERIKLAKTPGSLVSEAVALLKKYVYAGSGKSTEAPK